MSLLAALWDGTEALGSVVETLCILPLSAEGKAHPFYVISNASVGMLLLFSQPVLQGLETSQNGRISASYNC